MCLDLLAFIPSFFPLLFHMCPLFFFMSSGWPVTMCTSYGGTLPTSNTVPTIFTTSMKSCYNQAVLPRFFFPQCGDFPQRIHLPNMSTSGNSVEVIAYNSQLQPQYQREDEETKGESSGWRKHYTEGGCIQSILYFLKELNALFVAL